MLQISGPGIDAGDTVVLLLAGTATCEGAARVAPTQGGRVSELGFFSVTLEIIGLYTLCRSTIVSPTLDEHYSIVAGVTLTVTSDFSPPPSTPPSSPPIDVVFGANSDATFGADVSVPSSIPFAIYVDGSYLTSLSLPFVLTTRIRLVPFDNDCDNLIRFASAPLSFIDGNFVAGEYTLDSSDSESWALCHEISDTTYVRFDHLILRVTDDAPPASPHVPRTPPTSSSFSTTLILAFIVAGVVVFVFSITFLASTCLTPEQIKSFSSIFHFLTSVLTRTNMRNDEERDKKQNSIESTLAAIALTNLTTSSRQGVVARPEANSSSQLRQQQQLDSQHAENRRQQLRIGNLP